jgi:hypothetical protein
MNANSHSEPIFYQNAYHAWHYSTIENNWDTYDLPIGTKFLTMNAPGTGNLKDWLWTRFRVDMYLHPQLKRMERGYVAELSKHYDTCPVADECIVFSERIAIVGSRDYPHLEHVTAYVNRLPMNAVIVSGGAKGVDSAAENAAKARRMKVVSFPVDRTGLPPFGTPEGKKEFGKRAFARNQDIVNAADRVVAFHHKNSDGTANTIRIARQAGKQVTVYDSTGEQIAA